MALPPRPTGSRSAPLPSSVSSDASEPFPAKSDPANLCPVVQFHLHRCSSSRAAYRRIVCFCCLVPVLLVLFLDCPPPPPPPPSSAGISITLLFVGGAIATPVWLYLAQRMGKWEAWVLNSLVLMLTNLVYLIPREGQNLFVLVRAPNHHDIYAILVLRCLAARNCLPFCQSHCSRGDRDISVVYFLMLIRRLCFLKGCRMADCSSTTQSW